MSKTSPSEFPNWVIKEDNFIATENFMEIIKFYVFFTPCVNVSSSSISMTKRGWPRDVWKKLKLKKHLLEVAELDPGVSFVSTTKMDEYSAATNKLWGNKNFTKKLDKNRVFIYRQNKYNEILSLFFYIRCALAHGRFRIFEDDRGRIYAMEAITGSNDKYTLKARMIISEETLLKWARIISDKNLLERELEELAKKNEKRVLDFISNNRKVTKKKIAKHIGVSRRKLDDIMDPLVDKKIIYFDYKKGSWFIV